MVIGFEGGPGLSGRVSGVAQREEKGRVFRLHAHCLFKLLDSLGKLPGG